MARHLLRDYYTVAFNTTTSTFIGSYLTTIFMRRVLGYTYVGDTNYPINGVGTLLVSTADSTPTTDPPTFAVSTRAGFNLGLNKEFNVSIPVATRDLNTFGGIDKGRILVLKSTTNPTYNSGCFRIDGYDVATNSYVVNYRSGTTITPDTTIATSSNGVSLPTATINVVSTTVFPASGTILVFTDNAVQTVAYTSKNATQFLGCTGGTGIMRTGNGVANNATTLPQTTLTVPSTTGFPSSGTIFVFTSTGRQTVTYTGVTATTFTGCAGGTGVIGFAPVVTTTNTTIAAGSNGVNLNTNPGVINVASTTTATTTIASGSNNVALPQSTINVASTVGFPSSPNGGIIYVTTNQGIQLVTYTATTGTSFTGCSGGYGYMATGNSVFAGFAPTGRLYVTTGAGVQQVSYTGRTATSFTGVVGGTGVMSTGGLVYYSPNVPPIEAADSMNWYLYERDGYASVLAQGASNSNTSVQYRGNGTSTTPRIILQSPNPLAWQVRICHETTNDSGVGTSPISAECALITFAPGYGGDGYGDFAVGGPHLHTPLFFNSNSNNFQGGAVGFGDNQNIPTIFGSMPYRITVVGDTDGYGVSVFGRRPGNASSPRSYMLSFGMCEIEATPLPPNNEARLYAMGSGNSQNGGNSLNDVSWYPGNIGGTVMQGVSVKSAVGAFAAPITATVSMLSYAFGNGQQGSPIFDGSAGDTPWFGGVELFAVDVSVGVLNTWNNSPVANYGFPFLDGRFLGTIPHIREGRANYAEYNTTADLVAQHMRRGIWLLWGGPPVVT